LKQDGDGDGLGYAGMAVGVRSSFLEAVGRLVFAGFLLVYAWFMLGLCFVNDGML